MKKLPHPIQSEAVGYCEWQYFFFCGCRAQSGAYPTRPHFMIKAINSSEARLNETTRKTFLSPWSYQNPFYEKGKELCDVLVVFDNIIIIMSDKLIEFKTGIDINIAWKRWYKKAVLASVKQLRGAMKTILNFPERIFCDAETSSPFPLEIPNKDTAKIYLIAIANGAETAAKNYKKHPSLCIETALTESNCDSPFSVGFYFPEIVHVFNQTSLNAIFSELDTVIDFIEYLDRKEKKLSDGKQHKIIGEENLIAAYLLSSKGDTEFKIPDNLDELNENHWIYYNNCCEKTSRDKSRKHSYIIDKLIENFFCEYKNNRMIIGQEKPLTYHESAFRLLALESRLSRQLISLPLQDILKENSNFFWCNIAYSPKVNGLLYVFLTYPEIPEDVNNENLEKVLLEQITMYSLVAQYKFRDANKIFGICLPNEKTRRTSIIFKILDGTFFTEEMESYAKQLINEGILHDIKTESRFSRR